jgi:hypothetical protein
MRVRRLDGNSAIDAWAVNAAPQARLRTDRTTRSFATNLGPVSVGLVAPKLPPKARP